MFSYSSVPDSVQTALKNEDFVNLIKVNYIDPSSILKDYVPSPCVVTERFKLFADQVKEFAIRKDDVWVLGYIKAGTTFSSELVSTLLSGLDFEKLEQTDTLFRCPYMEYFFLEREGLLNFWEITTANPNRRAMRSHLPYNLLPRGMFKSSDHKMIYVARNPKDAAISWFHHFTHMHGYAGTLENLLDCYLKENNLYGSYFQHMNDYLRVSKVVKNLLVYTFEEFVTDPISVIRKVADFIGTPLNEDEVKKVAHFLHFDTMKDRKSSNLSGLLDKLNENISDFKEKNNFKFIRKGKKDSHKTEMPPKYIEMFNGEMKKWPEIMKIYPNF